VREYLKAGRGRVTDHFGRPPGVKEVDYQVKMRDGAEVTCRVHSPEQAPSKGSPLVIVYHGGKYKFHDIQPS
jgi:acetyl esterase/lipase